MRILLAISLLATSLPIRAQPDPNDDNQTPPFSYLFLNAAMTRDRDRALDVVANGFSLGGSVDLSTNSFLTGGYSHSETGRFRIQGVLGPTEGEIEDDGFSVGIGTHKSLGLRSDLTAALSYIHSWTKVREVGGPSSEDSRGGGAASLGLRHLLHPWIEASVGTSYTIVDDENNWDWSAGLGFLMTRTVWMDVDYYRGNADADGWSLGLRTTLGG